MCGSLVTFLKVPILSCVGKIVDDDQLGLANLKSNKKTSHEMIGLDYVDIKV